MKSGLCTSNPSGIEITTTAWASPHATSDSTLESGFDSSFLSCGGFRFSFAHAAISSSALIAIRSATSFSRAASRPVSHVIMSFSRNFDVF